MFAYSATRLNLNRSLPIGSVIITRITSINKACGNSPNLSITLCSRKFIFPQLLTRFAYHFIEDYRGTYPNGPSTWLRRKLSTSLLFSISSPIGPTRS